MEREEGRKGRKKNGERRGEKGKGGRKGGRGEKGRKGRREGGKTARKRGEWEIKVVLQV